MSDNSEDFFISNSSSGEESSDPISKDFEVPIATTTSEEELKYSSEESFESPLPSSTFQSTLNSPRHSASSSSSPSSDWRNEFACRDQKLQEEMRLWKTFTDAEYMNDDNPKVTEVPKCSFLSYAHVPDSHSVKLVNHPPKKSLKDVMQDMLNKNLGAIYRIQIGENHFFNCQPNILRCYCVYFANRDWRVCSFQFSENELPPDSFTLAYNWMRFRHPPPIMDAGPLMAAAKRLHIDLLEDEIYQELAYDHITERTAFEVFLTARNNPLLKELRVTMLARVRTYFLALLGHDDFLDLSADELVELLSLDSIGVNSEIEVFFGVMRWLNQNPDERQKHLRQVMECVRFAYMPMFFLFRLKEGCNRSDRQEVFTEDQMLLAFHMDPNSLEILENAMALIGIRCQHDDNGEYIAVCAEHKLKIQYPRRWVYHVDCPYHMPKVEFPFQHKFAAEEFCNYINSLQAEWQGDGPPNYGRDSVIDLPRY